MKTFKLIGHYIIPVIFFVFIAGCQKSIDESLPSNSNSKISKDDGIKSKVEHMELQEESDMMFPENEMSDMDMVKEDVEVEDSSAEIEGIVNANNLPTKVSLEYEHSDYDSDNNSFELKEDVIPSIVTGNINTKVHGTIHGLSANTTYHYRLKAENSKGVFYSKSLKFTTLKNKPLKAAGNGGRFGEGGNRNGGGFGEGGNNGWGRGDFGNNSNRSSSK